MLSLWHPVAASRSHVKTSTNSSKNSIALLWSEKASFGSSTAPHLKARARKRGNIWDLPPQNHCANKLFGDSEFAQGKMNVHFPPPACCEVPVVVSHEGGMPILCFRVCLIASLMNHCQIKSTRQVKSTICKEMYACVHINQHRNHRILCTILWNPIIPLLCR